MSAAELHVLLEQGGLPLAPNTFGIADLSKQLLALGPAVDAHADAIDAQAGTDLRAKLALGHRLLEVAGGATAARRALLIDQQGQTSSARALRARLVAHRDALVALANDRGVDPALFHMTFKRGDTAALLSSALAFRHVVHEHAPKLGDAPLVRGLVADVAADVDALLKAEQAQEERKRDALLPTALRTKARHALYAVLLHISRNGTAVFRLDEAVRETFRLRALHERPSARRRKRSPAEAHQPS